MNFGLLASIMNGSRDMYSDWICCVTVMHDNIKFKDVMNELRETMVRQKEKSGVGKNSSSFEYWYDSESGQKNALDALNEIVRTVKCVVGLVCVMIVCTFDIILFFVFCFWFVLD